MLMMAEKMNYSDTGAAKAVNQQTPRTQKASFTLPEVIIPIYHSPTYCATYNSYNDKLDIILQQINPDKPMH